MGENAKRDENRIPTLIAVSNVDGSTPVRLWADPVTHRLLVDLPTGSGDVSGPASAVADNIALFNGITGKIIKDGGVKLSDLQTALGYTAENVANKSTSVSTDGSSDTKYPSVKAVKDYADGLVAGLLDFRGAYDASGNAYPTTGGSGTAGAVLKGDMWIISVAGTLGGEAVQIGDSIIANTDNPGQTASNWNHLNGNISYVPENVANKVTSISGASTDTQYPSAKLTYDQLALKEATANKENSTIDTSTTKYPTVNLLKTGLDTKAPLASPTFTGTVTLPTTQLGETSLLLDETLSADEKWSGITTKGTAGATLAVGDVCYLASSGKWLLNDGILDGTDTGFSKQLGICVLAANDTQATEILLYGKIRSAAFPTFTVGSPVYLDDTAGDLVVAQPSTTNFCIRKVGYALTAEDLMFNPSNDFIVHV